MSTFLRDDATFAQVATGDLSGTAWTTYTPTLTAQSGSITSYTVNSARWQQIGKSVFVQVDITITTAGTGSGYASVSAPATSANATYVLSGSAASKMLQVFIGAAISTSALAAFNYDGTSPIASSARIQFSGVYEAA